MAFLGNFKGGFILCSAMLMMTTMMTSHPACAAGTTSQEEYVVETVVMVDEVGVAKWKRITGKQAHSDLETEMRSILYEVNEIYKSLDATDGGVKIRFQLKELAFPKGNFISASVDHYVESNYAAEAFSTYLDLYRPTKFDVAILYTGNEMMLGTTIRAKGFGKVGQLCTKKSLGVIKLTGTFDDVLTTAHEMAHVFDARHDDGVSSACKPGGYIMTNWKAFLTAKRYQFSSCSRKSIANKIKQLGAGNCLVKPDKVDILSATRYGALMPADAMCKRKFNSLSYVSRKEYSSGYGDNVCLKLACRENTSRGGKKEWRTSYIPSPDGLYCGKNKQCLKGKCVHSAKGKSTVSDTCPFGDQPVIEGEYPKGCGQVLPKDCPKFKDVCCNTCDETNPEFSKTADDVCRSLEGEHSQMLRHYSASNYTDTFCSKLTCLKDPNFLNGKFNSKTYPAPDGTACGKNKRCSSGACVVSADGNPAINDLCPFGDQPFLAGRYNKTCDDIVWRSGCKSSWGMICCGSCTGGL